MRHSIHQVVQLSQNYLWVSGLPVYAHLFQNARKQKPAVIFIDEVDALAAKRKTHGGEEAEKTLTELLVQLDGGNNNDGVLFIAATNRKDMLDDAFLRPGRIDYSFQVPLPDTIGKKRDYRYSHEEASC